MRSLYIKNRNHFITIVTYNRVKILVENAELLKTSIKNTQQGYSFVTSGMVVFPDHMHMIVTPYDNHELSEIIRNIKRSFTAGLEKSCTEIFIPENPAKRIQRNVWEKSFFDHLITDEKDFHKHLDYMHYNPVMHGYCKSPKDWFYSSFKGFVMHEFYDSDWGMTNDPTLKMALEYDT